MNKIVILGSCGAGKSTLARKLDSKLDMKVYHLDRIFWQRGWKEKSMDTRIDILQGFVREKRWIIEGNYLSASELHLEKADTIIFLDIMPLVCLKRILKRHYIYRRRSRRDIPEGCTDKLTLRRIWKVLTFRFHGRKTIKQKLLNHHTKHIIWLRSPKEVENFLAQLEPSECKETQLSKMPSLFKKKMFGRSKTIARIYQPQLLNQFKARLNKAIKGMLHDNIITSRADSRYQRYADVLRASRTRRASGIVARLHRLKQRLVSVH